MANIRTAAGRNNNRSSRYVERFILLGVGILLGRMLCNTDPSDSFTQLTLTDTHPKVKKVEDKGVRGSGASFEMKHGGMCPLQGCTGTKEIREAWSNDPAAVDLAEATKENDWTEIKMKSVPEFKMVTRDPNLDKFISGRLRQGLPHDEHIGKVIVQQLQQKLPPGQARPVFIDVGTNIGYFTSIALAMGAEVISFEPMRPNYGCVMATARKNGWQSRHHLYLNAVSFEGTTVNMAPTNTGINLSNGHVTKQECEGDTSGTFGVDWMQSVSLDQVMLTKHPNLKRIQVMKVDVERFEVHVINGAMRFLCNIIVEAIAMEVEYIKPTENPVCDSSLMQDRLEKMGYGTWSGIPDAGGKDLTGTPMNELPSDVVFVLKDRQRPPIDRLKGQKGNPCEGFEI